MRSASASTLDRLMTTSIASFVALSNACIEATAVEVPLGPVEPAKVVRGDPRVGSVPLLERDGLSIGVWEITPSVTTDVEVEELFIVVAGEAQVTFSDGTAALFLQPGTVGRLAAGAEATWDVRKTLRKVYVIFPGTAR